MSVAALAALGALPIVAVSVLLVGLRWSAARAMAVGWILAAALGLGVWQLEPEWWVAAAVYGALQALEIVAIVFGAILLMNHLDASGALASIRAHFTRVSADRRVQLLLVGLGFMTLVEGAAGFGTPGALAAPLLVGLGFPPLAAAVFGLFFNALQPPFGAAGTPIIGGFAAVIDADVLAGPAVRPFLEAVTGWTAVVTGAGLTVWGLFGVFLMIVWFGPDEDRALGAAWRHTRAVAPLALLLGALTGGTQLAVAWLFGPELPDIAAGFVALGAGIALARARLLAPRTPWDFGAPRGWPEHWHSDVERTERARSRDRSPMPVWLAWTPYLIVATVLLVTRWPGLGVGPWLRQFRIGVDAILGQDLAFSTAYLYLPGVLPFLPVAALTAVLHRMPAPAVASAWGRSARQIRGPALTLVVAVSMTQVLIRSATNTAGVPGMMEALSSTLARAAGGAMPLVAPSIGALGAFVTGSTTSSNVLFGVLQHDAAGAAGVPRTIGVALQNVGSGIGNMVSVLNIAAICGVLGMSGREGELLRRTLLPTLLLAAFSGTAGLLLSSLLRELY